MAKGAWLANRTQHIEFQMYLITSYVYMWCDQIHLKFNITHVIRIIEISHIREFKFFKIFQLIVSFYFNGCKFKARSLREKLIVIVVCLWVYIVYAVCLRDCDACQKFFKKGDEDFLKIFSLSYVSEVGVLEVIVSYSQYIFWYLSVMPHHFRYATPSPILRFSEPY